jgi:hypothetical protein
VHVVTIMAGFINCHMRKRGVMVRFLPLSMVITCTLEDMPFGILGIRPSHEKNDILDRQGLCVVHIHEEAFLST